MHDFNQIIKYTIKKYILLNILLSSYNVQHIAHLVQSVLVQSDLDITELNTTDYKIYQKNLKIVKGFWYMIWFKGYFIGHQKTVIFRSDCIFFSLHQFTVNLIFTLNLKKWMKSSFSLFFMSVFRVFFHKVWCDSFWRVALYWGLSVVIVAYSRLRFQPDDVNQVWLDENLAGIKPTK